MTVYMYCVVVLLVVLMVLRVKDGLKCLKTFRIGWDYAKATASVFVVGLRRVMACKPERFVPRAVSPYEHCCNALLVRKAHTQKFLSPSSATTNPNARLNARTPTSSGRIFLFVLDG